MNRWPLTRLACLLLIASPAKSPAQSERAPKLHSWHRTVSRHQRELDTAHGRVDICFVGDSLTEFWSSIGKPVWDLEFHARKCVNLGVAADRVEDIRERVRRTDFKLSRPRLFVLLAGTNNLGSEPPDPPDAVATNVIRIAASLHRKCAGSRVLVLSILPSGFQPHSMLRQRITATNTLLRDKIAAEGADWLEFADAHDALLTPSGQWKRRATFDGTHLSLHGYDLLARAIRPHLDHALLTPR